VCEVAQSLQLVSFEARLVSESCLFVVLAGSEFQQILVAAFPSILPKPFPFHQLARLKKKILGWVFVEHLVGPLLLGSVCFRLFPWFLQHFLAILPDEFLLLHSETPALLPTCPLSCFLLGAAGSLPGLVFIQLKCPQTTGFHQYRQSPMTASHSLLVSLMT
jgi:hypothetical protein